jgi:hypothetical protein
LYSVEPVVTVSVEFETFTAVLALNDVEGTAEVMVPTPGEDSFTDVIVDGEPFTLMR